MKHDFTFSSLVATKCIDDMNIPTIIRCKSDNCATQYKCSMVFGEYIKMAKKYDRNVIVYYGASGHGKGLVDAMSAFGVKRPLLKAVLTQNFKYNSAKDILDLLSSLFQDDPQKLSNQIKSNQTNCRRGRPEGSLFVTYQLVGEGATPFPCVSTI